MKEKTKDIVDKKDDKKRKIIFNIPRKKPEIINTKYDIMDKDLNDLLNKINTNFDFKSFEKDKLISIEEVGKYFLY